MRVHNLLALAAAVCLAAGTSSASTILISSDAANIGNGQLQSTNFTPLNGFTNDSGNTVGRVLDFNGGNGNSDPLNPNVNSQGLDTGTISIFRGTISGGNAAFGLVEAGNGNTFGQVNQTDNGVAFANSGLIFLVSDVFNTDAFDSVSFSAQIGSTNGVGSAEIALFVDGVGTVVSSPTGLGNDAVNTIISDTIATSGSSVQLVIAAVADGNNRINVDNINLSVTPIPEPNAVALSLLALSGLGAVGMRNRLG